MELKLIALMLIVLLGSTVEAISGFGKTVISVTIGSNFYDLKVLLPVLVPLNIILSGYILSRHHKHLDKKFLLKEILPFMCFGLVIGISVFNLIQGVVLKKVYGLLVVLLSVRELIVLSKGSNLIKKEISQVKSAFWIIMSGIVQGIYATGGPLLVYALSSKNISKETFRTNLSTVWLIMNTILLITYLFDGKITMETLTLSFKVLPMLPIGIFIGEILHNKVNEKTFRIVVFSLLLVAGSILASSR